jgi:hypothetical protein
MTQKELEKREDELAEIFAALYGELAEIVRQCAAETEEVVS